MKNKLRSVDFILGTENDKKSNIFSQVIKKINHLIVEKNKLNLIITESENKILHLSNKVNSFEQKNSLEKLR